MSGVPAAHLHPWDAARAHHPDAPICRAAIHPQRGWRDGPYICGYPIDPANGPLTVHPWCEAAPGPASVPVRALELHRVRADNRQRVMREATDR